MKETQRLRRGPLWRRRRVQLGGGLLLATILPFCVAAIGSPQLAASDLFAVSFWGSTAGVVLGFWFTSSLNTFPGTGIGFSIAPIITSCFAGVFASFFLLRLDYSRPLLLSGWLISVAWFYSLHTLTVRNQRPSFAIVPFGRAVSLSSIPGVTWSFLCEPQRPAGCSGVAADFEHGLTPAWEHFLAECTLQGLPVFHYKQLRESLTGKVEIEHLSQNAFGSLIPNNSYLTIKLFAETFLALIAIVLLIPVAAIVAIMIRLDSNGPILFKQQRVGYRGQLFEVWKFRTMKSRIAAESCPTAREDAITTAEDVRITRLGQWLRRSRIDELPQLWNVVRGEMSLIGPRPEAQVLANWYEEEIPFYRYRHIVRPGISGWAQVSQGHVSGIDEVLTKLSYDFYYISNFGFWLDMLILMKTLLTMVTGFGAR